MTPPPTTATQAEIDPADIALVEEVMQRSGKDQRDRAWQAWRRIEGRVRPRSPAGTVKAAKFKVGDILHCGNSEFAYLVTRVRESGTVAFDLSIWTDHKSWAPVVVIWRGSDENNYSLATAAEIHAAGIPVEDIADATLRAEVESLRASRQSDARKAELVAGLDDGSYVAEPVDGWPVGQYDASGAVPADLGTYESDPLGSESLVAASGVASNGSSVGDTQTALGAVDGTQGQSDASGQPEEEFYVVKPETEQTRDALVALCEDQCMKGGGQSVRTTIYRIARALMDRLDIERGAARRAVPVWPCLKCLATIPVSEGQRCSSCRTSARSPSGKAAEGENVDRDVLKVGDIQFAPIVKECALADALEREAVDANYDSPTDLMQRIARISRATL